MMVIDLSIEMTPFETMSDPRRIVPLLAFTSRPASMANVTYTAAIWRRYGGDTPVTGMKREQGSRS
jgi:hypothetical protein